MVVIVAAAILITSLATLTLVGSVAISRTEQILAQTAALFLRLGSQNLSVQSPVNAQWSMRLGGLMVEGDIPAQYTPWPWYRPISEAKLNSDLVAEWPMADARLTTLGNAVVLWVRAPNVISGNWLGFPVAADYLRLISKLLVLLALVASVILIVAGYVVRQIHRPLEELAEAASLLGQGAELPPWKPKGAIEIRRLGEELYQAADSVRRSVRDREFLFAGISHDLRTPIARMRLALDFLQPEDEDEELKRGITQDLDEINALVSRFVEQLREGTDERPVVIELAPLIEDVAQAYRSYGQTLDVSCRALRPVQILPLAFRRLLRNLIQNAIDHGKPPISIEAWTTGNEAFVSVRDFGPGLSEKRLAVLRRRVRQSAFDSARSSRGLGLRIAERIAESHGGQLRLVAANPGLKIELRWPLPRGRRYNR